KGRNNALLFGDIVSVLFGERLKVARVENDRRVKKLGPRDIGRVQGWRGGDDEYGVAIDNNNNFLEERFAPKRNKGTGDDGNKTEKKLGPRDIGTAHGWKGANYKLDNNPSGGLFEERSYSKKLASSDETGETVQRKEGPRDYQKPKTWKGAKYNIARDNSGFLEEKPLKRKSKSTSPTNEEPGIERKLGPRDQKRTCCPRKKLGGSSLIAKIFALVFVVVVVVCSWCIRGCDFFFFFFFSLIGPRDYGKTAYQGADYGLRNGNGDFLEERVAKRKDGTTKAEKKAGPRDIGKAKYHRPDWDKNTDNE
ncbi:hypothetical protein RFI_12859, partial [Reticulomyxa filosa]